MALQGISTFCGIKNQAGLRIIEYVPTAWIDRLSYNELISDDWNWQIDMLFTQGGWMKAPVLEDKKRWSENQKNSPQGKYYDQEVKGIVPHLKPSIAKEFDSMADYRYLLRIEDIKNQKWILGTIDHPFEFKAAGTSGENGSLKHHAIIFTSQTLHKAYGFNPL